MWCPAAAPAKLNAVREQKYDIGSVKVFSQDTKLSEV